VLGVEGAAEVLARRLGKDLTPGELGELKEAMNRFHIDHYMALSNEALKEARDCQDMAREVEIGEAASGADLMVAQELNHRRRKMLGDAQRVLGTALGEMEANAAVVVALERATSNKPLQASMGSLAPEDAITRLRAIGLDRGDYQVDRVEGSTLVTVTPEGLAKLARPVDRAELHRTREAMAIIDGKRDEDGWLPEGVATRPELAMQVKPGTAPRLAAPFPRQPGDVGQAVQDFIGQRAADGMAPADIMGELLTEENMQAAGDRDAFMAAVNQVAPLYDDKGGMIRAESHAEAFDKLADAYVDRAGGGRTPLHRQKIAVDQQAVDALHQALAQHPEGAAAWKQVGELTAQDQGTLRQAFAKEFAKSDPKAAELQRTLEELAGQEPAKETQGLFGVETNPEWLDWKARRDGAAEAANAATMTWPKYVAIMGSPQRAYAAMQDVVRSKVLRSFADHHNRLKPDQALRIGRTAISDDLRHLDALDPDARERRLKDQRDLVDRLRNRVAGKYAAGGVGEKLDAARAAEAAQEQAQMGLFGAMEEPAPKAAEEPKEKPLELGQRFTLGHATEQQIAGMMPIVGANFRPGTEPVQLWQPTMSGKYVGRQRAVKLIEHNRRMMLGMGTGSGKTSISLAAFTHLHSKGKAKRGLFIVPSVVQGQFHGEALTLLQPGKYRWHANPGASTEERRAAYKDQANHFNVVTHQGFRDDVLHFAAQQEGSTPEAVAEKLDAMTPEERAGFIRQVLDKEGIDHDYVAVDEGHNLLNRVGKQNSHMANVIDAVTDSIPNGFYVNMTADPVKNDVSELYDVFAKMDRKRAGDRAAFMRRYGVDTGASRDELKREMARCFYTAKIDPGVKARKQEERITLDDGQREHLAKLDKAMAAARIARMKGGADLEALKVLSPGSFDGVPEEQHQAVAQELNRSLGIIHNTAVLHAMGGGATTERVAELAAKHKGKPGVVFVHSLDRVKEVAARLEKDGHRVVTMTGADSSKVKDQKKAAYKRGEHDVMIMSDAGAVGANMQTGKWLVQYDTPPTAMVHAQRAARIHRVGQTEDVDIHDLVPDHPAVRRQRDTLARKYELRDITTSPLEGLDDTGLAGYLQRARAGQLEDAHPHFMPAEEGQAPQDLAEPDEQQSLF